MAHAATPAPQAQCGRLWGWGANHLGQMGAGPDFDQFVPVPVPGLPPVCAVCTNASAVLALDGDGRVWSWGWNTRGMLGRGRPTDEKAYWLPRVLRDQGPRNLDLAGNPPEMPGALPTFKDDEEAVSDAAFDAELKALLGSMPVNVSSAPDMEGVCPPGQVPGLPAVVQIAMGDENGFALDRDGAVWAWGAGGCMGGTLSQSLELPQPALLPMRVTGLPPVVAISAHPAGGTVYALDTEGTVWSWGHGYEGELGQGKRRTDPVPAPIVGLAPVRSIHALNFSALAVLTDGQVVGWGSAESGVGFEAARKNTWRVTAPVPVQGLSGPVRALWVGHSLAVYRLENGSTWVCGTGVRGMYPSALDDPPRVPRRQPELDSFVDFFLGDNHGFALDAAGALHGFGRVESGALGQGEREVDVLRDWGPITMRHPVCTMAAAGHHSFAVCAAG